MKVPNIFWPEAYWTFYVLNRCPTHAVKEITPQEAWSGVKPNVDHFRVWGSLAHIHVGDEKRRKLDDKSITGFLLSFPEESKGYRLCEPKNKRVVISKEVVFEETKGGNWKGEHEMMTESDLTWNDDGTWEESDRKDGDDGGSEEEQEQHVNNQPTEAQAEQQAGVREGRTRRIPQYLNDYVTGAGVVMEEEEDELNMVYLNLNSTDLATYEEEEKITQWRDAIDEEIKSIEKNQTWELCTFMMAPSALG